MISLHRVIRTSVFCRHFVCYDCCLGIYPFIYFSWLYYVFREIPRFSHRKSTEMKPIMNIIQDLSGFILQVPLSTFGVVRLNLVHCANYKLLERIPRWWSLSLVLWLLLGAYRSRSFLCFNCLRNSTYAPTRLSECNNIMCAYSYKSF